mgnify:FL=1
MKSQHERILKHLRRKTLTRAQAMDELAIGNLTARISELRQAGYDIRDRWKAAANRYGDATKYKVYYLA